MTTATAPGALKRTPFYDIHVALGAKIVPFAGYEMPVQYPPGITAEHKAVRERCGLFDVSHMGEFIDHAAPRAVDFVNYVTTNDVAALAVGQVHYSTILNERGTIEDDCLVYRFADQLMMVVNASNVDKDFAHIARHADEFDVHARGRERRHGAARAAGTEGGGDSAAAHRRPTSRRSSTTTSPRARSPACRRSSRAPATPARTASSSTSTTTYATKIWDALMATGDVTPAGLGARDTLRLEMGMALYGNDIDDTVTPLEANLGGS